MLLLRSLLLVWVQAYMFGPELTKLPLLFMHYNEHLAEDSTLEFNSFLALHYSDTGHDETDHPGHEDLPFHHHHGAPVDQHVAKLVTSEAMRAVSFPVLSSRQSIALPVDEDLLAGHHSGLLRPPRTQA
jgi:hypothetical protein